MSRPKLGLLVMHYGTPASMEAIEPYYTHIRHGRPPAPEDLADLVSRYAAIGGPSPLTEISHKQAAAIRDAMTKRGLDVKLYVGAKHAPPFIGDVVRQMAEDGIERAAALVLAPHYSSFSVAAYRKTVLAARDEANPNMTIEFVERWGELPEFIEALADRVEQQSIGWDPEETLVIFSAHSLPTRILGDFDPYPEELMETSRLVAKSLGIPHWTFAFQSASKTGEPWLGPDILDVIDRERENYKNVLSCTVGFVSDHLEVLYDLGIETREHCEKLGLGYRRADTIGADSKVMDALARSCIEKLNVPAVV